MPLPSTFARSSRIALTTFALVCCACSRPADPGPDASSSADAAREPAALSVVATGASTTRAIVADEGGTLTLATSTSTYTLEISPGALAADVEITLEEVTVPELPSARAVRFSPDGLVFEVPASLTVDAPYDDVMLGLAFRADVRGVEMVHAAPHERGLAMAIEHFSEAALVPADDAETALDDEQAAAVAAVTSIAESQAYGLGRLFRGRIAALVARADLRILELEAASRALQDARAAMMSAGIESQPGAPSGPPTVGELAAEATMAFEAAALRLYTNLTHPTCVPGRDVIEVDDWARAVHRLRAAMSELALVPPPAELCVTTRLRVASSPASLLPATDEVVLTSVTLELVGPGSTPEVLTLAPATFHFVATGATGPEELASASGTLTDLRFARPPGIDRPAVVSIVVTGHTTDTQLGALPAADPVTVVVAEPASYSGTIAVRASCSTAGRTSIVCDGFTEDVEVIDLESFALDATIRITGALGAGPGVEVTSVAASRATEHQVDEDPAPRVTATLGAPMRADAERQPDGRLLVRFCGPTERVSTTRDPCGGAPTTSTTSTDECFQLMLRPTPSGAALPERFVPDAPASPSCASPPELSGELIAE